MGMVNQLGEFSNEISKTAGPLRELLKTKNDFIWLPSHDKAFEDTKNALMKPPILYGKMFIGSKNKF